MITSCGLSGVGVKVGTRGGVDGDVGVGPSKRSAAEQPKAVASNKANANHNRRWRLRTAAFSELETSFQSGSGPAGTTGASCGSLTIVLHHRDRMFDHCSTRSDFGPAGITEPRV